MYLRKQPLHLENTFHLVKRQQYSGGVGTCFIIYVTHNCSLLLLILFLNCFMGSEDCDGHPFFLDIPLQK